MPVDDNNNGKVIPSKTLPKTIIKRMPKQTKQTEK
jgi:hypothetical protein